MLTASEAKELIYAFGVDRSLLRVFDALADGWFVVSYIRLEL